MLIVQCLYYQPYQVLKFGNVNYSRTTTNSSSEVALFDYKVSTSQLKKLEIFFRKHRLKLLILIRY